jgi:hypothetical protein
VTTIWLSDGRLSYERHGRVDVAAKLGSILIDQVWGWQSFP